jgi:hypothetical protein
MDDAMRALLDLGLALAEQTITGDAEVGRGAQRVKDTSS